MIHEEFADNFPVKDENGQETGRIEVRLSCKDYSPYPYDGQQDDRNFTVSKYAERELITLIADKFAQSGTEDIELIFDMLLTNQDPEKITKTRFKDYLLESFRVKEKDVDILLKTNVHICDKDYIDLNDFRNMFEQAIIDARQRQLQNFA